MPLPPRHLTQVVEVVCCRLTPLQTALYNHFLASKVSQGALPLEVRAAQIKKPADPPSSLTDCWPRSPQVVGSAARLLLVLISHRRSARMDWRCVRPLLTAALPAPDSEHLTS